MTKNTINAHLGNQLRARRTLLGLSQEAVGKGVGVASQQVQKYEKGTNVMSAIRLYEFAQFLKVPVAFFYDGLEQHGKRKKTGFAEDAMVFEGPFKQASERETLEVLKSFRRLKDPLLRKRIADMLRILSGKDV